MSFNLNLLSCPKCGGKLNENGENKYTCSFCDREWEKTIDTSFDKILGGVEAAIQEKKAEDFARIKRALYEETHKDFISNTEVQRLCKDILEHYNDEDFYALFYLATCDKSKTAFPTFCETLDIEAHISDIPDMLDYLITGLKEEWITNVSEIIERAFKSSDTDLYSEYRNKFEDMATKVNDGIYEPTLPRDVFVMYSGKDMDKVLKMVSVLENEYGLSCFVAARNLRHGAGSTDRYKDAIHDAIDNCSVYLLISSSNSRMRRCEVYEEILYIMENRPDKPRVEYLAEDYKGHGIEKKFREFFEGLEYCTDYITTAERIVEYCDDLQRNTGSSGFGSSSAISGPIIDSETAQEIDALLAKAKRLRILKKTDEALAEYEKLANDYPTDIRAFIGIVATVSDNYTVFDKPEIPLNINVINNFFGEAAAIEADSEYADYINILNDKKAKETAEAELVRKAEEERIQRAKEAEERKKQAAAEAEQLLHESEAQIAEAKNYLKGTGGAAKDETRGFEIIKKLAESGNSEAQALLGECYQRGIGVESSYTETAKWYEKSARQGNQAGCNGFGFCYKNGIGADKDLKEAVKWFRKAAEMGYAIAQYNLACCYRDGHGVTQSYYDAVEWYKKAADQGDPDAQFCLGCRFEKGQGVNQSYTEAVSWYTKAANQGNANAQNNLGQLYQKGQGVNQSYTEAVRLFRRAADNGLAQAQYNLALCYKEGHGVSKSFSEAISWLRKAADQGNTDAQHSLGVRYENGEGTTTNISEAVNWYRKAARGGNQKAKDCLKRLGYSI